MTDVASHILAAGGLDLNEDVPACRDLHAAAASAPLTRSTVLRATRSLGAKAVAAVSTPSAGSGLVVPGPGPDGLNYAPPGTYDRWMAGWIRYPDAYRLPRAYHYVWVDPAFKHKLVRDIDGVTLYDAYKFLFLCLHRACGVAIYEVPWAMAQTRFVYGTPSQIQALSTQYQSYGIKGVGGVYYAMRPGDPVVYTGGYLKPAMAGGRSDVPLPFTNAVRIPGYAWGVVWGLWGIQDQSSPAFAMRNPNLGGPIRFPGAIRWIGSVGSGGFDWWELNRLAAWAGFGWIDRVEKGLAA